MHNHNHTHTRPRPPLPSTRQNAECRQGKCSDICVVILSPSLLLGGLWIVFGTMTMMVMVMMMMEKREMRGMRKTREMERQRRRAKAMRMVCTDEIFEVSIFGVAR